jgi:hypothetical protein
MVQQLIDSLLLSVVSVKCRPHLALRACYVFRGLLCERVNIVGVESGYICCAMLMHRHQSQCKFAASQSVYDCAPSMLFTAAVCMLLRIQTMVHVQYSLSFRGQG